MYVNLFSYCETVAGGGGVNRIEGSDDIVVFF